MTRIGSEVVSYVRRRVAQPEFRDWCVDLLGRITDVNTAINPDVAELAAGERKVFDIIEAELRSCCGERVKIEFQPIDPAIESDPYYGQTYYTRTAARPEGLSCAETYAGRGNLLAMFDGTGGVPTLWNAHIDTVAPFYPSGVRDGRVYGRGSTDDKGSVAAFVAQIRLLEECRQKFGLATGARVYQFVIEEEMGGNGSLSASGDKRFAGWQAIIGECTSNVPHPANRGCVWYRIELDGSADGRLNLVEMAAHVVLALESLGRAFKAEGSHPLFRPEHVQTCHGVIGPFGKHPSAVNDLVVLTLWPIKPVTTGQIDALYAALEQSLDEYIARYGDKSRDRDEHGQVKVPVHFVLDKAARPMTLTVHGKAGHMGAIHLLDCAIIKATFLVAGVMALNEEADEPVWKIGLEGFADDQRRLVLEGGQGFVPTHAMEDVQRRMVEAAESAARRYAESRGVTPVGRLAETTFNKLHNAAFACPADMPAMAAMRDAFGVLGLSWPEPTGWKVSCDARIFARDGRGVLTFGPGDLAQAHSAEEFLRIDELMEAVAAITLTAIAMGDD